MTRKIFPLKLTPQERALLDAHATAAKMTAAEWLRRCITDGTAGPNVRLISITRNPPVPDERPDDFGPE